MNKNNVFKCPVVVDLLPSKGECLSATNRHLRRDMDGPLYSRLNRQQRRSDQNSIIS